MIVEPLGPEEPEARHPEGVGSFSPALYQRDPQAPARRARPQVEAFVVDERGDLVAPRQRPRHSTPAAATPSVEPESSRPEVAPPAPKRRKLSERAQVR